MSIDVKTEELEDGGLLLILECEGIEKENVVRIVALAMGDLLQETPYVSEGCWMVGKYKLVEKGASTMEFVSQELK